MSSSKMKQLIGMADSRTASAMVTMIIVTAVLMVMGAGMYFMATRQERMSQADKAGGQAFYYSEGGLENVMDILNYAATETQLVRQRSDQSPDGFGYLMDPDSARRESPPNPLQMQIGNQTFTVWVDEVDQNGEHCSGCGLNLAGSNAVSYLKITAEGRSNEGYRKLEQLVMLKASKYPLRLFIHGDADINGNPSVENQNIYVEGNMYNRSKLNVTGTDVISGGPAGVMATGLIYAGNSGTQTQIYNSSGGRTASWDSIYHRMPPQPQYDRDSYGPAGDTFTLNELNSLFNSSGLSSRQLDMLKSEAQTAGYYLSTSGDVMLRAGDLPGDCKNIVIFIEYPAGNPATNSLKIKFPWPPGGCSPDSGKAVIVVRNASITMSGADIGSNFHGIIYSPDGPVTADGAGGGSFTGFVWATAFTAGQDCRGNSSCVGFSDTGNFDFRIDSNFYNDLPPFTWTVTRMTEWTEVDR